MLTHWKTTLAGVGMILVALLHIVQKGQFGADDQAAILGGLGLIVAKDFNKGN